jgi:hypothetical protein
MDSGVEELTGTLETQCIPNIAIEIIVTGQEKTTRFGEGNRCDATNNIVMGIHAHFLISTNIEQATCRIV